MKTISKDTPDEEREEGYSKLGVLHSPAGYYIGRMYWAVEEYGSFWEPGSRESDYFKTSDDAQKLLDLGEFEVRECPENESSYESGDLPDLRQKQESEYN